MTFDALVLQLSRQTPWRVANDSPYVAEVLHPLSDRRASIEDRLLAIGAALPLVHRVCWERTFHPRNALFVCLHDAQQQPVYGWTVLLDRSRAMPGHTILRVRRFGATVNLDLACAGLAAMRRLCELLDNVLRLELEVFNPDSGMRDGLRKYALQMGFKRLTPQKHGYHNTIRLELDADQEMLFQRLTRSARRNVKAPEKKALRIRPITEPSFAPRMEQLMRETFARSGGPEQHEDWAELIAFSQARPELSRIIACQSGTDDSPEGLLAFAWACVHGDHASHTVAASTRVPGSNLALSYATAWDLIVWARHCGCRWFDFGGVTAGTLNSDDALGGISDFKRFFSDHVITVGDEWVYDPVPFKGVVADSISALANWVRTLPLPLLHRN